MLLKVSSELIYEFPVNTQLIASVQAASSADQWIISESLIVSPEAAILQDPPDQRGERRFRAEISGEARIAYEAVVDNGIRSLLPSGLPQHAWTDLPQDVLQYLTPSRYCPSDKFISFAKREFGQTSGSDSILAIHDWIYDHVEYRAGVSTSETTAERTFIDRAGVCRDFSHLGITLSRALNIPARAVSAYALNVTPPDFHAIFEVFVGGSWWLVDPTRLASIDGVVRIGVGRDAADIAFLTTSGSCKSISQTVAVTMAEALVAA